MTVQEAINILKIFTTNEAQRMTSSEFDDAIYMAIAALENQKDTDCIIKHLTKECSYNETGCSGCKGKIMIKKALEKQDIKETIDLEDRIHEKCPFCGEILYTEFIDSNDRRWVWK